jgi:hypothetical protein
MSRIRHLTTFLRSACCALALFSCSGNGAVATGQSAGGGSSAGQSADAGLLSGPGPKQDATPVPGSASQYGTNSPVIAVPRKGSIAVTTKDQGQVLITCDGKPCACNDGIDNDKDGVTDGFDAECTGPFDGDEGSFATGIPGDNKDPKWQDCFFDGNSGAGDDRCRYPTGCLDGSIDAKDSRCEVAEQCRNACAPLAPPGCDCFGCCEVYVAGKAHDVLISDSCSTEKINDASACTPCTRSTSCQNECGECELCLGKTLDELPAKCFTTPGQPPVPPSSDPPAPPTSDPPPSVSLPPTMVPPVDNPPVSPPASSAPPVDVPPNSCDNSAQACSLSTDCAAGSYCALGCCRVVIVL